MRMLLLWKDMWMVGRSVGHTQLLPDTCGWAEAWMVRTLARIAALDMCAEDQTWTRGGRLCRFVTIRSSHGRDTANTRYGVRML